MEQHYLKSSFREKLIEHLFISELLKDSWHDGSCSLEFAKPEVDNQGYDLIAEQNGIIRHIQLKASHLNARTANQKVHVALWLYLPIPRNGKNSDVAMPFGYFVDQFSASMLMLQIGIEALVARYDALVCWTKKLLAERSL